MRQLLTLLLLGNVLAMGPTIVAQDDLPYSATWRVSVLNGLDDLAIGLVKLDREGRYTGTVVDGNQQFAPLEIREILADAQAIRFQLRSKKSGLVFDVAGYAPKGKIDKDQPKRLYGGARINGRTFPLMLEKTTAEKLEAKLLKQRIEGADEFEKLQRLESDKDREKALEGIAAKYPGSFAGFMATRALTLSATKEQLGPEAFQPIADRFIREAQTFGTEMQLEALNTAARPLFATDKGTKVGLAYARQAVGLLSKNSDTQTRLQAYKLLARGVRKTGDDKELSTLRTQIGKIEDQLDQEYEKTAIPFKVGKFQREGKSNHVAVVELFTGAQCPPCVAADTAFDAAIKYYNSKDVVFLQYHLHIPGPDPLTNKDTEDRQRYYNDEIEGTPTAMIDGKATPPLGGGKPQAEDRFDVLKRTINKVLQEESTAKVDLQVTRKDDKIDLAVQYEGLKDVEKVRLRLVLVEETVRYAGGNQLRLHHHVVRAMPGGAKGFEVKAAGKQTASVTLSELRQTLQTYLLNFEKKQGAFPGTEGEFPLQLEKLSVVALLQDDANKRILQAVQVQVPAK